MKQSEIDKKEKQVIAWEQELKELLAKRREREIVDLPRPITKGYILSFELTEKGENNLSERGKELFYLDDPQFFIKDKQQAKNAEPNIDNHYFGDYYVDPDSPKFSMGYFWPLVIRTRGHNPPEGKGVYYHELNIHFKQVRKVELFDDVTIIYRALRIKDDYFRVKRKKYKQKRIWAEEAYIDSRTDYLRKKLFDEKNWHKYGTKHHSHQRDPGKQPEGLYQQKIVGMSPSYPYKRSAQKEQTQTLIEKAEKQNGPE